MLIAASLIAVRLEAQFRLTVTPPVSMGKPATMRRDARDVESLFALLLHAAPADVFDRMRIDARARESGVHDVRGEVFGSHISKVAFVARCAPIGVRTASIITARFMDLHPRSFGMG